MSVIANNIVAGAAGQGGADAGYQIERSLRFNSADSSYLSFQPSSAGNRRTWTWSGWAKRSKLGASGQFFLFQGGNTNFNDDAIRFEYDKLVFYIHNGSNALVGRIDTEQVFRDTSAWYHIVVVFDTTNATADDRMRFYVNGEQVTDLSHRTNPPQNTVSHDLNDASIHYIGTYRGSQHFFDGYLADVHFIDGQALTADDFGEFDDNGVWQPKEVSITSPNDGTNWASSTYLSSTSHYSTYVVGNGFDGDENSQWLQATQGGSVTFSGISIPYTSSVEIKLGGSGGTVSVNGGTGQSLGANSWNTIASGSGTLTSLSWQANGSEYPALFGIKIDGVLLVANAGTYGTNGFHLDFSDNSSNAALGYDAAGSNDWTVNNLVADAGNNVSPSSVSLTPPTSGFLSGRDSKFYVMDGDTSSYLLATSQGDNYSVNFSPGITVNSSVEIYGLTSGQSASTNLSSSTSYTSGQYTTIYSGSGTLTQITMIAASGRPGLAAIKVDGVLLIGDNDESVIDSLVDSPTNGTQTDTGAGGEVVGNYCTWNPNASSSSMILSNGNLESMNTGSWVAALGSIGVKGGKWYWEMTLKDSTNHMYGIAYDQPNLGGHNTTVYGYYSFTGQSFALGAQGASYGSSSAAGDVIGVALDLSAGGTNGTLTFYKNNISMGTAFSNIDCSKTYFPWVLEHNNTAGSVANFGQREFVYAAPSGFKAINTASLPDPTIADGSTAMDAILYTGNGTSQTISGLGFSPDFVWTKLRSIGFGHRVWDTVRGATKRLETHDTTAEVTESTALTAFTSDGFSVGSESNVNLNSGSLVAWAWDAGTSTVTNNNGSITSTVRASASSGFSIVTFNMGSNGAKTVGHGLNAEPHLIITKCRTDAFAWRTYHKSATTINQFLELDSNGGISTSAGHWGSAAPTSSVFGITSGQAQPANEDCVAYCFAPVEGYSSFGSYQAGTEPFVFLGFRPRYVLIKRTAASDGWVIFDTSRATYNVATNRIEADTTAGEGGSDGLDLLSNGFKIKTSWGGMGGSSGSGLMIYAAFAENPFKTARAR